ncbi:MAG: restriction endonuclease subunit S [Streptococcus anginosus]
MATVKLGDIAIEAKSSNKGDKTGIRIVGLEHLTPSNVTLSSWSEDTENTFTKEFSKGDVLFGRRRAYLKKAAVAPFDGICSGDITVIRAVEDKVDPDLLPFIIQNDFLFDFAVGKSAGSLSPRVKWTHLKEFTIDLPSMPEQSKLAEILWSIIETKNAYEDFINKTDELVKSQFIEMFGSIESEGIFPRKEWSELLTIINGKDYRKIKVETGGYPVFGSGGYMARASEFLCPANTVIVGRKGTINNPLLIKEEFWNVDTAFGVVSGPEINPVYLHWFCLQFDFTTLNKATTLPSTTKSDLLKLKMNVPPINSQNQFEKFVEQSDKSKFALQEAIKDLDALSKKIIAENLIPAGKE